MDYSGAEEHPEASPWATSPQPTRTTFEPTSSPYASTTETEASVVQEQPFASEATGPTPVPTENGGSSAPATGAALQKPAEEQRRAQPVRTRPDRPKYKLQAKITGLERQGRKDPILKFDVYV